LFNPAKLPKSNKKSDELCLLLLVSVLAASLHLAFQPVVTVNTLPVYISVPALRSVT